MVVTYDHEPQPVKYMPLPDGQADVWIRAQVQQVTDEEGTRWTAQEVYFHTRQTLQEVANNAMEIFFRESGLEEHFTKLVQDFMDKTAQTRGYDNIASACSYANSTDTTFRAEGQACLAWRDSCWRRCYNIEDSVKAGLAAIPTDEALLSMLPALEW